MKREMIFAGFGGQGVLLAGQLLSLAAMAEGRHVTWYPSYGAEMRGGTANCSVIISDRPIGSPLVGEADLVLAFNRPATEAFAPRVAAGGALVYNSSLASSPAGRSDIGLHAVPAGRLAAEAGLDKAVNLVMLGAALAVLKTVSPESVIAALTAKLGESKRGLWPANQKALALGRKEIAEPAR